MRLASSSSTRRLPEGYACMQEVQVGGFQCFEMKVRVPTLYSGAEASGAVRDRSQDCDTHLQRILDQVGRPGGVHDLLHIEVGVPGQRQLLGEPSGAAWHGGVGSGKQAMKGRLAIGCMHAAVSLSLPSLTGT